jgi:hypothetical protein
VCGANGQHVVTEPASQTRDLVVVSEVRPVELPVGSMADLGFRCPSVTVVVRVVQVVCGPSAAPVGVPVPSGRGRLRRSSSTTRSRSAHRVRQGRSQPRASEPLLPKSPSGLAGSGGGEDAGDRHRSAVRGVPSGAVVTAANGALVARPSRRTWGTSWQVGRRRQRGGKARPPDARWEMRLSRSPQDAVCFASSREG